LGRPRYPPNRPDQVRVPALGLDPDPHPRLTRGLAAPAHRPGGFAGASRQGRRRDVGVRTALVLLHAVSGIVGLVAGLLALPPPGARRTGWRMLYAACVARLVAGIGGSAQLSHCRQVSAVSIPGGSATIGLGATSGCRAAWHRASFGTKRPWVQIPPPRSG